MRIEKHPILNFDQNNKKIVGFVFNGKELTGFEGEPIITALVAQGIIKTRHSPKKHRPLGPFCMQGRCGACMMTVNGKPNTMTCVTPLTKGVDVRYQGTAMDTEVFKKIPKTLAIRVESMIEEKQEHPACDIAIIGAGPAGMEAAITCRYAGVPKVVLLDDKSYIGGQLALQTHTFFGNEELGASKRGIHIAKELSEKIISENIDLRLNSTVVGIYPDNMLAFKDNDKLNFLVARKIIVCTGASEKNLAFEGNNLPGVMGAGAAQTFVNLYGVIPGKRILIIGGGNIGVILAYQLAQAGAEVVGVVEGSSKFGAYQVHVDKVSSLGIPMFVSHTILKAMPHSDEEKICSAVIAEVDKNWNIIKGSEKTIDCDTVCIAVGLNPLNELLWQAGCDFKYLPSLGEVPVFDKFRATSNPDIYVAGDCAVIGEASIARLEGRLAGLKASLDISYPHPNFRKEAMKAFNLLDNIESGTFGDRLGKGKKLLIGEGISEKFFTPKPFKQELRVSDFKGGESKIFVDCPQDIPCNPCEKACPFGAIFVGEEINQQPDYSPQKCVGCGKCLLACPGRAISLIQYNYTEKTSRLTLSYEFLPEPKKGEKVELLDSSGRKVCDGKIIGTRSFLIEVEVLKEFALKKIRAARIIVPTLWKKADKSLCKDYCRDKLSYVCRCEEVSVEDIKELIDAGYSTINEIRRIARVGMGPCRGNQCRSLVEDVLKKYSGKRGEDILNVKMGRRTIFRAPTKRITLGEAARLSFSQKELDKFEEIEKKRTVSLEILDTYRSPFITEKKTIKRNIVIVGGGISGVCTAWELARLGLGGIVVIEKNFIASGASGAALGGIRTGFATADKIRRAKYGLDFYANAEKNILKPVGWFQGGYVYLAFDEKTYNSFMFCKDLWLKEGVQATVTTEAGKIREWMPGADTTELYGAVLFPQAGGANPFNSAFYIAESAKKMGVEFLVGEELTDIFTENGAVKSCLTSSGLKISCDHVVNAAGSFAVRVARMVGIDLSQSIFIDRHESLITEKMPLWLDPLIVNYHTSLGGYWQQKRMEKDTEEGEIVACFTPSKPLFGYNTYSNIYCLSRMAKSILLCQPNLQDVGIVRSYADHYVGRKSGIPIIGDSPVKGFWFNIGKQGHGYMCAPGDAYALAQFIKTGKRHEWLTECVIDEDVGGAESYK